MYVYLPGRDEGGVIYLLVFTCMFTCQGGMKAVLFIYLYLHVCLLARAG